MVNIYRLLIYLHVLLGFIYMLAHGTSATASFRLRHETSLERIRAYLDLSRSSFGVMYASLMFMLAGGIALGFLGRWWSAGWIWVSLGLLIAIFLFMAIVSSRYFHGIRKAAGLPYFDGKKDQPAVEPLPAEELVALLQQGKPHLYTLIGVGGWAAILWLMIFKPF
jgi:small-conductance mechanosensitive channel